MTLHCPACRRPNDGSQTCARCGADLTALQRVQAAAQAQLVKGRRLLRQGRGGEALASATLSWRLKKSPAAARLAFLASLYLGRFDQARRWYAAAAVGESGGRPANPPSGPGRPGPP
ncbi:MAG TPA: hypothetical protein VK852_09825 [Desulfobacterales bacterium]|jgi:hypothetical protein|nr:hypothetical protein [Desulfobacterales bacterium]